MSQPHSAAELAAMNCRPVSGSGLDDAQIRAQLAALPDWQHRDGALERSFGFDDYWETIAFVNALAWVVHRQDHHPDLTVGYNRCTVRWNTHSVGGISISDFICAAKTDAVFRRD